MNMFVPNVIVVGNVDELYAQLEPDRRVNVVAVVEDITQLRSIETQFDYIVFTDHLNYFRSIKNFAANAVGRIVTADFFARNVRANFYSYHNDALLLRLLLQKRVRAMLDVDAYFARSQYYIKPAPLERLTVDAIRAMPFAINDNFYSRVYNSLDECRLRHYNVVLLTAERNVDELRAEFSRLSDQADEFIVFVRRSTDLKDALDRFANVQALNAINGQWLVLRPRRDNNFAVYVVAHKKFDVDMPIGYKTIHAGRALGADLGFIGDDSGDNISNLNPYLNELTALYWIWRNAAEDIVGISHYRRFFSSKGSTAFNAADILTVDQARALLDHHDMIIGAEAISPNSQRGLLVFDAEYDDRLAFAAIDVIKKNLELHQPEYLDAFEQIIANQSLFGCNMMIARKYVFDAYCQWLFSFLLPAAEEFIPSLESASVRQKRILGFVAERMFGVWLLNQRLRLRELSIMIDKTAPH